MESKQILQIGEEKAIPSSKLIDIGLSWEMFGERIDLDLTAVMLSDGGQLLDAVYFKKTLSDDESIKHSGDERSGKKEGYDEKISIFPEKINPSAKVIAILVNSSSGQSFQNVETAELSIYSDGELLIAMNCGCKGDHLSIITAFIYRDSENNWRIRNIAETGNQTNFVDSLPLILSKMKFLVDEDTLKEAETWNAITGKSFDLKKGDEISLPSCLEEVAIGLGWETNCDIDSSIITIDKNLFLKEYIYYGNKHSNNDSIIHLGDNTTGAGEGDDENITINLLQIPSNIIYIGCSINVFTAGKTFGDVTEAFCRLIDWKSKKEFCKYNLNEFGGDKACIMCYLRRDENTNKWKLKALGKFMTNFDQNKALNEIKIDIEGEKKIENKDIKIEEKQFGEHYVGNPPTNYKIDAKNEKENSCCYLI